MAVTPAVYPHSPDTETEGLATGPRAAPSAGDVSSGAGKVAGQTPVQLAVSAGGLRAVKPAYRRVSELSAVTSNGSRCRPPVSAFALPDKSLRRKRTVLTAFR